MISCQKKSIINKPLTKLSLGSMILLSLESMAVFLETKLLPMQHYNIKQKFSYLVQQLLVLVFIFNIGDVAVGSMKGEIRLYNKVGKQAKTLIPALGDPIIGMDASDDGKVINYSSVFTRHLFPISYGH